jgi:2-haloacid dehalogenase
VELDGITFDAFGTLFDLNALRTRTRQAAGHEGDELFAAFKDRLIPWSWHATASGDYVAFPELAIEAVMAAARDAGFPLERSRAEWIVEGLKGLPAFEDVVPALEALADRGVPLAILTNGTEEGITALVENAGIRDRFAHLLTADTVRAYKPSKDVYALATEAFGAPADRIVLVSGHEWDLTGAAGAGLRTAWVARGERLAPVRLIEPEVVVDTLADLPGALAA